MKDMWLDVLDVGEDHELLREFSTVCRLPWEIWRRLGSLPNESLDLASRHLDKFEQALLFPMDHPWMNLVELIQGEPMLSLEFASHLLDQSETEPRLDEDLLADWDEKLTSLDSEISAGIDIDVDIRWILRDHIRSMRSAIKRYRISGSEEIKREAEATIGDLVVRHADIARQGESKGTSSFAQRLALLAGAILATIGSVKGALEVGEMIHPGPLPAPVSEEPEDQP